MEIIDTHCHLDDLRFADDLDAVIERAERAGVSRFIVASVKRSGWNRLANLAGSYSTIHPAFGLHPWFCDDHREEDLNELRRYLDTAVAIGECGLDFGKERASEELQLKWFRAQLELAAEQGKPVIVHAYKSLDRVLRELKRFAGIKGVIHGFYGSRQQAKQIVAQGFLLGIGSSITRPGAEKFRQVVAEMPVTSLLLESDAPDQPGDGHRGERNEPAWLVETAAKVAECRKMSISELIECCNRNARELFRL